MLILSAFFWWTFEFINLRLGNWEYIGLAYLGKYQNLFSTLSFSTVLPAFFETSELIQSLNLLNIKMKKNFNFNRKFLTSMIIIGIICFLLVLIIPKYAFPLTWLSLFFIFDPINFINKNPSILGHLKKKDLKIPVSLLISILIMAFFWEFWNYWAIPKWIYHVPFVGFFKVFEMPVLGYLGYLPFSFELYSMYWFFKSMFK
jgi:hypothetical protein